MVPMKSRIRSTSTLFLLPLLLAACVPAPDPSDDNDWRYYGKDAGGTRYSALAQINRTNIQELEVAWIYRMGEVKRPHRTIPDRMQAPWECTPLAVDGVLYLSTPSNRIIALEAETGRELWEFDPQEGSGDDRYYLQHRGVSYWEGMVEGKPQRRILMGTGDARLLALDAGTGQLIPEFGEGGWVDLDGGMTTRWPKGIYTVTSPVAVYKNVVVTGSRLSSGQEKKGPSGKVRAWDVLTGDLVWEFHTVPRPGEPGNETWEGDSWKDRSGANAWSIISVDTERGWVFAPTASPLGGDRDGQNLYGNTLLVLDALTGKLVWHYQMVRHDTWDYDLPAQPALVTLERDGREVPAVAQPTKMGMVFVLDRLTGQPLLPVEERPVPQTGGGYNWPTQPITVKPPPLVRHNLTRDEVSRVTPESYEFCLELFDSLHYEGIYTPRQEGPTLMLPGSLGGANWSGSSFDPTTGILYVNVTELGNARGAGRRFWQDNKWPCQEPPWGTLNAVDLNRGEIVWKSTLGVVDELMEKGVPKTGTPNLGGSIVTAGGLVFIGGTNDRRFRAFDAASGEELWVDLLEANAHATPMTFWGEKTGKQYVVIAAGGGNVFSDVTSDGLVAYALP